MGGTAETTPASPVSAQAPLLIADSFRVRGEGEDARVLGFSRHLRRFLDAAAQALHERSGAGAEAALSELQAQLHAALPEIAAFGDGFPRLELRDGFSLTLRPLPALTNEIEMVGVAGLALDHPEWKGPNLARLQAENRRLGTEALLLDDAGNAIEGATTSLLWWRGETLVRVAASARVPSVTEALVVEHASRRRIPLAEASATPAEIVTHETWAVNALHGIRTVTSIDGAPLPKPEPRRLHDFREALERSAEPVLGFKAADRVP